MPDCGCAAGCRHFPLCVEELHRTRIIDHITFELDSMRELLHSSPGARRIEKERQGDCAISLPAGLLPSAKTWATQGGADAGGGISRCSSLQVITERRKSAKYRTRGAVADRDLSEPRSLKLFRTRLGFVSYLCRR